MEPEQLYPLITRKENGDIELLDADTYREQGRQALLKELKEEVERLRSENDDLTGQTHSILDLVLRLITSKMKE